MSGDETFRPVVTPPGVEGVARVVGGIGGIRFQWEELDEGSQLIRGIAAGLRHVAVSLDWMRLRLTGLQLLSLGAGPIGMAGAAAVAAAELIETCRARVSGDCAELEEVADNITASRLTYELAEANARNSLLNAVLHGASEVLEHAPFHSQPLTLRQGAAEDVRLHASVDGLLAQVAHARDQPGGAFSVLEVQGEAGRTYVVVLPGTEDGMDRENPFSVHGIAEAKTANSRYVNDAVCRALQDVGATPGADVILVGYSQGGMHAMNLANDGRLAEKYSVGSVITAGSPVGGEPAPSRTAFLHLEHQDDAVPMADSPHAPDRPNQVSVILDHSTEPFRNSGGWPAHNLQGYREGARAVDTSDHPSLAPFAAALGTAIAAPYARRHTFQVTRPPLVSPQVPPAPPQPAHRWGTVPPVSASSR